MEAIPGRDGGFRIIPGYAVDRSVLGEAELATTAAALGEIRSAVGDTTSGDAEIKLDALLGRLKARRPPWIRIALTPGGDERPLIEMLRGAIEERRVVRFQYRDSEDRESERRVEPTAVAYIWSNWYLWAYCRLRGDWRLFRLSRIRSAKSLLERFDAREEPSENAWRANWDIDDGQEIRLRLFGPAVGRARESFGRDSGIPDGTGGYVFNVLMPRNEWLFTFLFGFGEGVEVLSPADLRREFRERVLRLCELNKPKKP